MPPNSNKIKQVLIPIRDYDKSAKSRENFGGGGAHGGLIGGARDAVEQKQYYYRIMSEYILKMTKFNIPTTFINFDKMVTSPEYLFEKMQSILEDVTYEKFLESYKFTTRDQIRK